MRRPAQTAKVVSDGEVSVWCSHRSCAVSDTFSWHDASEAVLAGVECGRTDAATRAASAERRGECGAAAADGTTAWLAAAPAAQEDDGVHTTRREHRGQLGAEEGRRVLLDDHRVATVLRHLE